MSTTTVHDIASFVRAVEDVVNTASHDRPTVFRGVRDVGHTLVPGIARFPFEAPKAFCNAVDDRSESAERILYVYFQDYCAALMPNWVTEGSREEIAWRKLIVAQHHRLPTRLLDWTTNSLVALFFAVEGDPKVCDGICCALHSSATVHHSAVHALINQRGFTLASLASKSQNANPPHYGFDDKVGLLLPPHVSPRIAAQSSVFTIRKDPAAPIPPDATFVIPHGARRHILSQLDQLGISRRVLFPDMDGIAEYLKWVCR